MDNAIVQIALDNLHQATTIRGDWKQDGKTDGVIKLIINGINFKFATAVKNEVRPIQLYQIEERFYQDKNFMLVANRIFPKVKEALREKEIPYLEANGNVFLRKKAIFLFVDTQKPIDTKVTKGNRAFTKTGLKVLFHLLQYKDHINLAQRELARLTEVGLGNISQIIEGLKETAFIIPLNSKAYVWENRKALLHRWVADYGTILRPKLKKEKYTLRNQWKDIVFDKKQTVWGGEPAADLLTQHLRPEKFIIYTRESKMDLIKNYNLIPDENGEIEVLEMFWKQDENYQIPPLLVYADLLLEGGKRNLETADIIYNHYVQSKL